MGEVQDELMLTWPRSSFDGELSIPSHRHWQYLPMPLTILSSTTALGPRIREG